MTKEEAATFFLEESRLMWNRVQTATAIEAGALAGWYKVWTDKQFNLSIILLIVGAVLLFGVSLLMKRDAQYMDCCEKIAGDKLPTPEKAFLGLKGRRMAVLFPGVLGVGNILLAIFARCIA